MLFLVREIEIKARSNAIPSTSIIGVMIIHIDMCC